MKNNRTLICGIIFAITTSAWAQETWEGSDSFSSAADSAQKWKKVVDLPTKGKAFVEGGEVHYSATGAASDAAWAWGKKGYLIPSSASWELECLVRLPTNAPLGVNFTKAGMFIASPSVGQGAYRALTFKVYQRYDSNNGSTSGYPQPIPETDYARGAELERSNDLPLTDFYTNLALVFRHDALNQKDDYEVYESLGGTNKNLLASESYQTGLAADPNVVVGFLLAGKPKWSGSSLALDDWSVQTFNPGSIDLPAISKAGTTIGGSAWTLTISDLRLEKAAKGSSYIPKAEASLGFGSTTLSIPVTGSIQKDGSFLLTGKGSGSAKGYGFTVVYDTYNSVRITGKTTVTAPKQRAIKF